MSGSLVNCSGISKKFCRSARQSAFYGLRDISAEIAGFRSDKGELRKGEFWAVDNVSFEIGRGDCLGIIGPNGAGKSTLLKLVNGIISPDRGRIAITGKTGALIEVGAGFHPMLTGRENIYISGTIHGMSRNEISKKFDDIVDFSGCRQFLDTPVKYYSSGMFARLGFAVAVHVKPDILIIDEILSVGDMDFRARCFNEIYSILRESAVIFVSHNMPDISRICSHLMVMDKGTTVYNGRDVYRGINIYQSLFQAREAVIFDYRASFKNILLIDGNGVESAELKYGDTASVVFDMEIDAGYDFVDINVIIANQFMQNILQYNSTHCGVRIRNTGKLMKMKVDLGRMYLNAGSYTLSLGITSKRGGEILAKYNNVINFRVTGNAIGYAPVQPPGRWQLLEQA